MAHYIDAERLKEQIQSLINLEYDKLQGNLYHVLNLIDSLQQEQPEQSDKYNHALEKAREWMQNMNQGGQAIFIDVFPELGENLDPRYGLPEQPVDGLEEEIARYLREECSSDDEPSISDIARHFAEWGAEHLKK